MAEVKKWRDAFYNGVYRQVARECGCGGCREFFVRYPGGLESEQYLADSAEARRLYATAEEAVAAAREVALRAEQERARNLEVAMAKSEMLFLSLLSEAQLVQWRNCQSIPVQGKSGRNYTIWFGFSGNVVAESTTLFPAGRYYCCYMEPALGSFPVYDHMIAQMLNLQFNEEYFLAKAY